MEEDQLRQQPQGSISFPIQGMESVVATVSGYHGTERFNLIKLITNAGANYVGAMSKSITHLICWRFEGKKYNLARKFRIVIINHQWIEDCLKQGRRVPEEPYRSKSGEEVGLILLQVPLIVEASSLTKNKVLDHGSDDIGSKNQTTDISSGSSGNSVREVSYLMNKEPTTFSSRQSMTAKRKISNCNGVATNAGPSRHRRRLVKKNIRGLSAPIHDLSSEEYLSRTDTLNTDAAASSSLSGGVSSDIILEGREGSDIVSNNQNIAINGASNATGQINDSNDLSSSRISTLCVQDALLTTEKTSVDDGFEKFTDGIQNGNEANLPISTELSCVICLTEFSSTRGVLPCGHRFCYSCIQSWVDHRTAMGKISTCPLCKSRFESIIKYEDAARDQKIYSQTIPCGVPISDIIFLMDREQPYYGFESSQTGACVACRGREPEDLLMRCHLCHIRQIHSYCLDPPLLPWTCNHCFMIPLGWFLLNQHCQRGWILLALFSLFAAFMQFL
ncbi:uncharacterized protein LOC129291305 isoform X2 [Prosopis cineraria]|uniref:uncharacterized protein LOC129291305 isoform X2 n=1 Tax=Prosopis cineraria TaxID=364024 RepID=UPI00240EBE16|nr:uncharacterized protein LOC129291305 isoform X2 [Prosopis cineraria]